MPFPSTIQFFSRTTPSRKTVKSTHAANAPSTLNARRMGRLKNPYTISTWIQ